MNCTDNKIKVINLFDVVKGTSTNEDGDKLFSAISKEIEVGVKVRLSLHNCTPMSTSFLNSSFGELTCKYGYERIKQIISLNQLYSNKCTNN